MKPNAAQQGTGLMRSSACSIAKGKQNSVKTGEVGHWLEKREDEAVWRRAAAGWNSHAAFYTK